MTSKLKELFGTWTWSQLGAAVSLIVRLSIPLVGVVVLGWPQLLAALLYLFEVWLFLTLRTSVESFFRPPVPARTRLAAVLQFIGIMFGGGIVIAFLGGMTFVVVGDQFRQREMADFLAGGWRDPVLLISVTFTLAQAAWDLATYMRRVQSRDAAGKEADETLLRYRVIAYFGTSWLGVLGTWIGQAGITTILSLSGLMLWLEWPAGPAPAPTPASAALEAEPAAPKNKRKSWKKKRRR